MSYHSWEGSLFTIQVFYIILRGCLIFPYPNETLLQHNPHHVFHQFSYFVLTHSTSCYHKHWIYQTSQSNLLSSYIHIMGQICYPTKSWVSKSRFSFKVRIHGQQQLYIQYKICWISYKMVGSPSYSQPYLCIQPLL